MIALHGHLDKTNNPKRTVDKNWQLFWDNIDLLFLKANHGNKTMLIWSTQFKFSARNPGDQIYIGHKCIWIKFFNFKETVHARTYLPFLVHLHCVCFHPHCMENPLPETTLYHNALQDSARHNLLYLQRIMTAKTFLWGTESMTKASEYFC